MRTFDRDYFQKWYRSPRFRVKTPVELRRQVALALATTELVLGREVRTVLDVGCGEGQWRGELRRRRPQLRYWGVDVSEYAVRRFGRRRNIRLGSIETLHTLSLPAKFDLILCVGMLNYIGLDALRRGLVNIRERLPGVAYLEIFTAADDVQGDFGRGDGHAPALYRRILRETGFVPCGMHCYVSHAMRRHLAALELGA